MDRRGTPSLVQLRYSWFLTLSACFMARWSMKLSQHHFVSDPACLYAWYAFSIVRWSPSTCANCALASSAKRSYPLGRMKHCCTLSMATTESASLLQE